MYFYGQVVVYIEKIESYVNDAGEKVHYLLMDFPVEEGNFSNKNLFFQNIQVDFDVNRPSMIDISNAKFEKWGKPREGSYYILPTEIFDLEWNPITDEDNTSSNFLALKSDGSQVNLRFENALNYNRYSQNIEPINEKDWKEKVEPVLNMMSNGLCGIEVNVYNVGQGNWNEIIFNNESLLVYDIGSSSQQLSKKIKKVLCRQNRRFRLNRILDDTTLKNKILVISHWDIDHYNGIFSLPDNEIRKLSFCIVPNRIENDTTKKAVNRLMGLTTVYAIAMAPRTNGRYGGSNLYKIFNSDLLKIYKGTNCNDRNKRGLSLSLHTDDNDFIFPGDHHYHQIDRHLIPLNSKKKLNIVVPHHGGKAGSPNCVNRWSNCNDSIISTGGRYGHPFPSIINIIKNKKFKLHRTDKTNIDYTKYV